MGGEPLERQAWESFEAVLRTWEKSNSPSAKSPAGPMRVRRTPAAVPSYVKSWGEIIVRRSRSRFFFELLMNSHPNRGHHSVHFRSNSKDNKKPILIGHSYHACFVPTCITPSSPLLECRYSDAVHVHLASPDTLTWSVIISSDNTDASRLYFSVPKCEGSHEYDKLSHPSIFPVHLMLTVAREHPRLPRHPQITAQSGSHRSVTVDHDPEASSENCCHSIDFSRTTQNPGRWGFRLKVPAPVGWTNLLLSIPTTRPSLELSRW
jgi:hypothetical protein